MSGILTVTDITRRLEDHKDLEIANHALSEFLRIQTNRRVDTSPCESKEFQKAFLNFQKICSGQMSERYALCLPAGAGKTTSILAWCLTIHKQNLPYSLSIASETVEASFGLRQQLLDMGISIEDIGILYKDDCESKKHLKDICRSTKTPEQYRFLLVTHSRYKQSPLNNDYLTFQGLERNIIFWDESFSSAKGSCFSAEKIILETAGAMKILDRHQDHFSSEQFSVLKKFMSFLEYILEYHHDAPKASIDLYWAFKARDFNLLDLEKALSIARKRNLLSLSLELFRALIDNEDACIHQDTIYTYERTISHDVQRMVILDASYRICTLSKLDKTVQLLPISINRIYPNLAVNFLECPSGRNGLNMLFRNNKKKVDLFDRVSDIIKSISSDEKIIIMTFVERDSIDCTSKIKAELFKRDIETQDRIQIVTWGKEKGTNEFRNCQHLITIGFLDQGTDNYMSSAYAQTSGRYFSLEDMPSQQDIKNADYAQRLYQAINRLAIRDASFHDACTAHIFVHKGMPKILEQQLKGILLHAQFNKDTLFEDEQSNTSIVCQRILDSIYDFPLKDDKISMNKIYNFVRSKVDFEVTTAIQRRVKEELKKPCALPFDFSFEKRSLVRITNF